MLNSEFSTNIWNIICGNGVAAELGYSLSVLPCLAGGKPRAVHRIRKQMVGPAVRFLRQFGGWDSLNLMERKTLPILGFDTC